MGLSPTVLGQPMGQVQPPPSPALVVVLIDIDDFEVSRLAQGDDWAREQIEAVTRALAPSSEFVGTVGTITLVPPDAWIVPLGADGPHGLAELAARYAEQVRQQVEESTEVTVSVGVSRAHTGAARMEAALGEAVTGVERKLIDFGNKVSVFSCDSIEGVHGVPERIEEELGRAIRDSDVDGALRVLSAWIDRIAALEGATPEVLRRWITAEVMYALDVSGRRRLADGSVDWFDAFSRLSLDEVMEMSGIHDRSYLMLWLQKLLDRIVDVNKPNSAGRHVLALVEKHIQERHADELRLASVAAEVFVSPYYISHLFQRELDTTFLRYLTGVRMQHARQLLAGTDLPVDVISVQVGYPSTKRFRMLFKRTFKLTPSEYRGQHGR